MNWYVAKIVFRLISGEGNHNPQFDEQLRLISADGEQQAFEKAQRLGQICQDSFPNNQKQPVRWEFMVVAEINQLNELADGTELYYQIHEPADANAYMAVAQDTSAQIAAGN